MINETTNTKLREETQAYLQRMAPDYAALVDRYWQLVLEIFCKKEIERFHNYVFPYGACGMALKATLEVMEMKNDPSWR